MVSFVISSWARQNFFPLKGVNEYHMVVRDTRRNIIGGGGGRAQTAFRCLIVKKTSKQEFATDITKLFREKTEDKEKTHESKGFINAFTTPLSYRPLSIN